MQALRRIVAQKILHLGTTLLIFGTLMLTQASQIYAHEFQLFITEESNQELAENLVNRFWKNVEHKRPKAYSNLIAADFQGLNLQGDYNRQDQIRGLKHLTVERFRITNLKATRYDETLVISYDFHAHGQGVTSGPCIDVWHRPSREWKLISHSYVPFK